MHKYEIMSRYILNEVETSHHYSVVFHFDDFNYGRRSQSFTCFLLFLLNKKNAVEKSTVY
jgi:hypothetical protein